MATDATVADVAPLAAAIEVASVITPAFGSQCGACKFLRRRCIKGCVFAPCFSHEQGPISFAAIHTIFGAKNASKLLVGLPTGGLSNRQKEHKKAMPIAAKRMKVARSRQDKKKKQNRSGKQFRGKKGWK